jgi:small subunit ribosomal protein S5
VVWSFSGDGAISALTSKEKNMSEFMEFEQEFDERVVEIARVAKVVKGGRRFSFRVTIVVGDNRGQVGVATGKANSVPDAMRKASEKARRDMHKVALFETTIPHEVIGRMSGAKVLLKPASPGTGVIAGGGVRAVLEAAGISDILTKSLGSDNLLNVVYATVNALDQLRTPDQVAAVRGKTPSEVTPFWERRKNG